MALPASLGRLLRRTPFHPQWLIANERAVMDALLVNATGRVLDVGCADRWVEARLPPGCDYIGLDSVQTGQDLYRARPSIFGDAARLPVATASLDTVVMFEVLEHLAEPSESLAEARRVLRPGGRLLASVPFLYPIHDAPHDYQRYTEHGLVRTISAAGLDVVSVTPRLDSLSCAALLANLAMGGSARESMASIGPRWLLLPFLLTAITLVNLSAFVIRPLVANWRAMTNGYVVVAQVASPQAGSLPGN